MRDFLPFEGLPKDAQPFTDPNFKLAILSALIEEGQLDLGDFTEFLGAIHGPSYTYEKDGYEASAKAYEYLTRYPVPADMLNGLGALAFDGGNDIYPFIYPFWGGETVQFDIHSLKDLALLPNLRSFEPVAMLRDTDLRPLAKLQQLEELSLGLTGMWQHFETFLLLPRLRQLYVFGHDLDKITAPATIAKLRAGGVSVDIF